MFFHSDSYAGDGTSGRVIPLTFEPVVLVVVRFTGGSRTGFIWTSTLEASKLLTADTPTTTEILSVSSSGFEIGDTARVNESGQTYMYAAWGADADDLAVFSYTGDGTDNKSVGSFTFTPNMAWVLPANTSDAEWRTDQLSGDLSQDIGFGSATANGIQQLNAGSIQVGSRLTGNSVEHHVIVFKALTNVFALTEYTGNATDNRDVAHTLGATPTFIWIQAQNDAEPNVMRFGDMAGDDAVVAWGGSATTDRIQAVDGTNVQIGADNDVNQNTILYTLITFGENVPSAGGGVTSHLMLLGVG